MSIYKGTEMEIWYNEDAVFGIEEADAAFAELNNITNVSFKVNNKFISFAGLDSEVLSAIEFNGVQEPEIKIDGLLPIYNATNNGWSFFNSTLMLDYDSLNTKTYSFSVSDMSGAYFGIIGCVLDSVTVDIVYGEYIKYSATFKGTSQFVDTSEGFSGTPTFAAPNSEAHTESALSKIAFMRFNADWTTGLATIEEVEEFHFTINYGATYSHQFGSDDSGQHRIVQTKFEGSGNFTVTIDDASIAQMVSNYYSNDDEGSILLYLDDYVGVGDDGSFEFTNCRLESTDYDVSEYSLISVKYPFIFNGLTVDIVA